MGISYAEVIGEPIGHSKSPLIHRFWLEKLGLAGDFRARRVGPGGLAAYVAERCRDPYWRGCSVTAPLKQEAAAAVSDPTGMCRRIGASNAIFRSPLGCGVGANTDLLGIAEALALPEGPVGRGCVIGAGGAARAAIQFLRARRVAEIAVVARDSGKVRSLLGRGPGEMFGFDAAETAMAGADCVINATPLGQSGMPELPATVLNGIAEAALDAVFLDMVYDPPQTEFLRRAREEGRRTVDGLAMLVGQAAPAFELFFGLRPPREHDGELRARLTS